MSYHDIECIYNFIQILKIKNLMSKSRSSKGSQQKEKVIESPQQKSITSKRGRNKSKEFIFKTFDQKTDLTVILDLDNTLISALLYPLHPEQCDFNFTLQQGKHKTKIGIIKRPNVIQFLNSLSSLATVYLFTTSEREYANQILSQIDPSGTFISKIFSRENCTQDNCKKYVKNYSICGTDMKRTLIVDDLIENFKDFPKNGLHIKPFNGELDDNELARIFEEIIGLSYLDDVRDGISH